MMKHERGQRQSGDKDDQHLKKYIRTPKKEEKEKVPGDGWRWRCACWRHACLAPTSVRKKEPAGNKGRIILRSDKKATRGGNPCAMYCGNPTGRPSIAKQRSCWRAGDLVIMQPRCRRRFGDGRTDEVCACMATC